MSVAGAEPRQVGFAQPLAGRARGSPARPTSRRAPNRRRSQAPAGGSSAPGVGGPSARRESASQAPGASRRPSARRRSQRPARAGVPGARREQAPSARRRSQRPARAGVPGARRESASQAPGASRRPMPPSGSLARRASRAMGVRSTRRESRPWHGAHVPRHRLFAGRGKGTSMPRAAPWASEAWDPGRAGRWHAWRRGVSGRRSTIRRGEASGCMLRAWRVSVDVAWRERRLRAGWAGCWARSFARPAWRRA